MSSYDNFGTLRAEDFHEVPDYWYQNVDANFAVDQNNQNVNQNKNVYPREHNTAAIAELFEDIHRYIQEEQNSSPVTTEISQDVTPVSQDHYYQYNNMYTPDENSVQFLSNFPAQRPYPQVLSHHNGVIHRAHISLLSTTPGTMKTIMKRKRKRTIFTTEQVEELEKYFCKKPYVTREDRQLLVKRLNINDKAVKIWFQNRRLKGKRDQCHSPLSDNIMAENNLPEFHLNNIESQICEKTDKFGFVTLDDATMGNLVNIIDSCLSNANYNRPTEESCANVKEDIGCKSSPIYEPISPPDSTEEDENIQWQPYESTESLQTLLDLQSIIYSNGD